MFKKWYFKNFNDKKSVFEKFNVQKLNFKNRILKNSNKK